MDRVDKEQVFCLLQPKRFYLQRNECWLHSKKQDWTQSENVSSTNYTQSCIYNDLSGAAGATKHNSNTNYKKWHSTVKFIDEVNTKGGNKKSETKYKYLVEYQMLISPKIIQVPLPKQELVVQSKYALHVFRWPWPPS